MKLAQVYIKNEAQSLMTPQMFNNTKWGQLASNHEKKCGIYQID